MKLLYFFLLGVLAVYGQLNKTWSGCTNPQLCKNVTAATNGTCMAPQVYCTTQNCTRTTEFWILNPNQWPLEQKAFCYHTWQDILDQKASDLDGSNFPNECLNLAQMVITLRLNEEVGAVHSLTLMNLIDSAEMMVLRCCSSGIPSSDQLANMHNTLELLLKAYDESSTNNLAPFCNFTVPSMPTQEIVRISIIVSAVLVALIVLVLASLNVFIHYALICKSKRKSKEDKEKVMIMILQEKFSCYDILLRSVLQDLEDEYV